MQDSLHSNRSRHSAETYLTIDIGGTKILFARMSSDGKIEDSIKIKTPKEYTELKNALAENVAKITTNNFRLACIAAPGKINRDNGNVIAFGNIPWENVPIKKDLEAITGIPVIIENDAKLAALSEARLLDPPLHKVVYLTVSTGIGGGTVVDNSLDPNLIDGEVGHMLFEKDGRLVKWQSFASGKAIVERFGKMASEIDDPKIWKIFSRDLAIGIIDIAANSQPDIIIIGGSVGTHFSKYGQFLNNELKKYEHPLVPAPKVIAAKHPEEAVIYGCYELIRDYLDEATSK